MTDLLLTKNEDLILRKRLTKLVGLPFGKRLGQIYFRDLSPICGEVGVALKVA